MNAALSPHELSRLKWSCRRGMLENDLFIARFFARHGQSLSASQAQGLQHLMALPDPDLFDLLMARREPGAELDLPVVREVLALLRTPAANRFES